MVKSPVFGIVGFGMAGKSALVHLREKFPNSQIHVFDSSFEIKHDRVWCYWTNKKSPISSALEYVWSKLEVVSTHGVSLVEESKWRYEMVTPKSLGKVANEISSGDANIIFHETEVLDFEESLNGVKITTSESSISVDFCFQSVRNRKAKAVLEYPLLQHFLGWEIETKKAVFNPDMATIMDFGVKDQSECNFMYVLPFSENSALIESTFFSENVKSEDEYSGFISDWISRKHPGLTPENYEIKRIEKGVIPMNDQEFEPVTNRICPIGTLGSQTKPSSGYTFYYVQKALSRQLESVQKRNRFQKAKKSRFYLYDMLLLDYLQKYPEKANQLFSQLFQNVGISKMLLFLNEETKFFQEIAIMNATPRFKFLKALAKRVRS